MSKEKSRRTITLSDIFRACIGRHNFKNEIIHIECFSKEQMDSPNRMTPIWTANGKALTVFHILTKDVRNELYCFAIDRHFDNELVISLTPYEDYAMKTDHPVAYINHAVFVRKYIHYDENEEDAR